MTRVILLVFVNDYGGIIQLDEGSFCLSHIDRLVLVLGNIPITNQSFFKLVYNRKNILEEL